MEYLGNRGTEVYNFETNLREQVTTVHLGGRV